MVKVEQEQEHTLLEEDAVEGLGDVEVDADAADVVEELD